jgi:hypothetical protein
MPLPNENPANAIELPGSFPGFIVGNNTGVTQDSGVWYKYRRLPNSYWHRMFFFSTRYNPAAGDQNPARPLRTILRLYYGGVELDYFPPDLPSQNQNYSGWERGSQVMGIPNTADFIYIRIDGVNGEEGEFVLSWGEHRNQTLNACEGHSVRLPGEECAGLLTLGDVNISDREQSFGVLPPGIYLVRYLRGAWSTHFFSMNFAVVPQGNPLESLTVQVAGQVCPWIGASGSKLTYAEIEFSNRCLRASVPLPAGGEPKLVFFDHQPQGNFSNTNGYDIDPAYKNPMFGIYRIRPHFVADGGSCVALSGRYRCTLRFKNLTDATWTELTAALVVGGGITNPSAPVAVTIDGLQSRQVSFDHDITPAGNAHLTATLQLSSAYETIAPLTYDLIAVLTVSVTGVGFLRTCSGLPTYYVNVVVGNVGTFQTMNLVAIVSFSNGVTPVLRDGPQVCQVRSSYTIGVIGVGGSGFPQNLGARVPTGVTSCVMTITLTDGAVNHGTRQVNINFT